MSQVSESITHQCNKSGERVNDQNEVMVGGSDGVGAGAGGGPRRRDAHRAAAANAPFHRLNNNTIIQ